VITVSIAKRRILTVQAFSRWMAPVLLVAFLSAAAAARGDLLPACIGATLGDQETQDTNCVLTNPGGAIVVTGGSLFTTTIASVPPTVQTVNQYQTTLTAVLSGTTTVYDQVFDAPFSDLSVQNAIAAADALLASDGAGFGSPALILNSSTLESIVLSSGPTLDLSTIESCVSAYASASGITATSFSFPCDGVPAAVATPTTEIFGPAVIMTGLGLTDEFDVLPGQLDIDVDTDYSYTQNPIETDTYLITQSYEVDGTTGAVPEPATWSLLVLGFAGIASLRVRQNRPLKRAGESFTLNVGRKNFEGL
jgi:hypothetical protein